MQVQPPCQTQGAAATREALVVAVAKKVWTGGIGQALGKSTGEAGGEKPLSALTQRWKCCHSSWMSKEHGSFEVWLIIWGAPFSSEFYLGSTEERRHPPITTAKFQVITIAKPPVAVLKTLKGWCRRQRFPTCASEEAYWSLHLTPIRDRGFRCNRDQGIMRVSKIFRECV